MRRVAILYSSSQNSLLVTGTTVSMSLQCRNPLFIKSEFSPEKSTYDDLVSFIEQGRNPLFIKSEFSLRGFQERMGKGETVRRNPLFIKSEFSRGGEVSHYHTTAFSGRNPLFIKSEFSLRGSSPRESHRHVVAILYSSSQNSLPFIWKLLHRRGLLHVAILYSSSQNSLVSPSRRGNKYCEPVKSQSFIHQVRILSV